MDSCLKKGDLISGNVINVIKVTVLMTVTAVELPKILICLQPGQ